MFTINAQRLSSTFTELCEINSPSGSERKFAEHLLAKFQDLGVTEIIEDQSATATGSDVGNLVIRIGGELESESSAETVFFNCHLDVVQPCHDIKVIERDGHFTSAGDTVLGGDDKAGIAILLEVIQSLQESGVDYHSFEIVLTTCEEVGLLGAKAFDSSLLTASYGYSLDSTGTDNVIIGAPASHSIDIDIFGQAAHAGLHPEKGINAIRLAGQVLSRFPLGRLDAESTANIGLINGGKATNIVPDFVNIQGEIRSHSQEALSRYLQLYRDILTEVMAKNKADENIDLPTFNFRCPEQYPLMTLSESKPVIQRVLLAAKQLHRSLDIFRAGGGSDANYFNHFGLPTAILGVGMDKVHSTDEQIALSDMVRTGELIAAILRSS